MTEFSQLTMQVVWIGEALDELELDLKPDALLIVAFSRLESWKSQNLKFLAEL